MNLPLILGVTVFSVVAGALVSIVGYFNPFMFLATICMSVGAGMLANLKPDTGTDKWVGYQLLYGIGLGFGFQQALTAVQACLPSKDIPVATALVVFAQNFGGAVFLIVGQSVFKNCLTKNLTSMVPHLKPEAVINIGVTNLRTQLAPEDLEPVLGAYNKAITLVFYVCVGTAAASLIGALVVEWKSVRAQKGTDTEDSGKSGGA
jgi:hypothetical protein